MKLMKNRKTLGDHNVGMAEDPKKMKIKRAGTSINPFAMTFGAAGEEESGKAKGRKSVKTKKKKHTRILSGD